MMRFKRIAIFVVVLAVLPLSAAQAKKGRHAKAPQAVAQLIPALPPLYTTYDVYVGGFHLIAAQIWFEEQGSLYHAVVKAGTYGIWSKLFPWDTILDAHGTIRGETFVPQEFYTRDEWGHKPKVTMLHFDGKGGVVPEFIPPNMDVNRELVTPEQKRNSLDPVTAGLQILGHVAVDKSCAVPVPIFDGKRRFDVIGKDAGRGMSNGEDYGVFTGEAQICDAEFNMISGEWKDREHARFWKKTETEAGRDPFHIWLASPAPGLPQIPVRMESGSIAGLVVVHLSSWRYASADEIKAQSAQGAP